MQRELSIGKIVFALVIGLYLLKCILDPASYHFIDSINLIFHEAGHAILSFLGDLGTATAGSLFQVIIPALCGIYFLARREYYSAVIVFMWMGESLVNVSIYVGDAIAMKLPLLGDEATHDWNYALSVTGLISYTSLIARSIYISGAVIFAISALLSLKLSYGVPKAAATPKYDWMAK